MLTTVTVAAIAALGSVVAAYAAYKGSKASADQNAQSAFIAALQSELSSLRTRMDMMEARVASATEESRLALSYIERLLFWMADRVDDPDAIPPIPDLLSQRISTLPHGIRVRGADE